MTDHEVLATAHKMISLYGSDAEAVADGTAETHADCGEILEILYWSRVADTICELQTAKRA